MKTSSQHKQFSLTQRACMRIMLSCLIGGAFTNTYALPTGEQVKVGNASFVRDGQTLTINQSSQQAIVNWQSFGIAASEAVKLYQPNQGSALFQIVGSDPSQIFGSLTATGSLFLINPNGILFAPGAQVDVGNLVASTMQISEQDFLAKRYQFNGNSTGSVVNKGTIRTEDGGYIVLLGNTVENSGSLTANKGSVVMASAQSALLDFYGDGLVQVKLSGDALNAVVNNTGNITANGGNVQLATNARTSAINVSGVIQANSLVERDGVIRLEGGANSTVLISGKLEARGNETGTQGGYVAVTGERVGLLDGTTVDVSGNAGGGTVLIGGDYQGKNANIQNADRTYVASGASIIADALDSGDGGKVVVWANDITRYYGSINAKGGIFAGNGGFIEVSGKNYLDFNGLVNTSASYGTMGTLLLDPTNITISTGANSIESSGATIFQEATTATSILNTTTLQNALASNNVEVTTASPAASAGTITVSNAVTWSSGNSLTLTANSTIAINAAITTGTAASSLVLNATGNVTQSGTGIIGGAGGLTKNGVGTATLSLANTYTGATTINTGTLTMGANNVFANASSILVSGGTLNANNRTDTVAGVRLDSGSITGTTGALTSTTAFDLREGTVSKILGGAVGLNKTTAGTVILSGANTYTGTTTINAGTLIVNNNAALGTATGGTTVASGATLAVQGGRTIADALSITGNGTGGTAGALRNISGNNTYTGAVTLGVGGARINSDAGTLTISGAGNITGAEALTVGGASNTTISKIIATGAGTLTKDGAGTLTLSGANTYTGVTNINVGTLIANNNAALGTTAGGTTVADGATLAIQGTRTIADALTITGNGVGGTAGALRNNNNNNTYTGAITLGAGGALINSNAGTLTISGAGNITGAEALTVGGVSNTTISKVIATGTGTLTKNGTGTLTLSGANTYDGNTNINAGTLIANNNAALGTTTSETTVADGATLAIQGTRTIAEALTITGNGVGGTAGALRNNSQNNIYTGAITLGAGGALIHSNANTLTLSGAGNITGNEALTIGGSGATSISKVIDTSAGTLTKNGTGTLTLSGANTYTGATTVNTGTVIVNNAGALGTAAAGTTVNAGATLAMNGFTVASEALALNDATLSRAANNPNWNGTVALTGTNTLTGTAGTLTLGGIVSGAGNITKTGAGTVILSGNNTYTGATNVNAGILRVAGGNGIGDNSAVTMANVASARLDLNGGNETIGSLAGGGVTGGNVSLGAGALTAGADNTTTTYSGVISGAGGLTKTGTGTMTLAGANTYSGATNINAGTLAASHINALGAVGGGTTVKNLAALNVDNVTLAESVITINGNGIGGAGALTGTNNAVLTGTVTTASDSTIGTTSGASSLTLNGIVTAANNLGIVGTGDVTATNAANNFSTVNINGANDVSLRDTNAITLGNGASSLTGNLIVRASGNVTVANNVSTTGGDITLASTNFINTAGASALSASGRWLVYSTTPGSDTFGGLLSGNQAIWNTAYPTVISQTGNRYVFTNNPTLTVTSTNQSKTYGQDGAPTVANAYTVTGFVNAATFGNVFTQDTIANTVSGSATSTGSSVTANVAGYAIDVTPIAATTGYTLTKNSTGLFTVNPAALTVTASDQVKTYGQTFNFAGTEFTSSGLQNGETIGTATLASTGAGNIANVAGSPYAITASNATGGTFNAGNYTITYVNGAMTVNPAIVNISGSRSYDGTTAFNAASFGMVNGVLGQTLNLSGAGSVASANAGATQAVSLDSLALADGTGLASNYTLTGGTYTGTIGKANITISTTDVTKTYDGNTAALGTATVTNGTLFNNASNGGALDSLSGGTFAYTDKNAGTGNKTVTVGAVTVNDGNSGGNYQVTYADNTSSTINKANITAVTGITAGNKTYDGNTGATLNTAAAGFTGIVAGETLTVGTATGTFNSKDVLTANTVNISGITLADGADLASNYNLTNNTASAAANITAKDITAVTGITAGNKTYDGNTGATLNTAAAGFTGIVAGETLTVGTATGTFNSKDVLTANTVNISGITLADGADLASNYNLTNNTASAAANITPRALTVTADAGQTKVFGSADPASFTYATGGLGLVSGDNLTGFLIRNAGEVTGSYSINQGSLAADSNYTLTYIGNNFTILAPSTSPRVEAGLVDLNPALGNYTSQQLFVLNVDATAAGNNADSSNQSNSSNCEQKTEPLAKDKGFALMLNFGMNLPKGISTTCI